jgi:polysaccharide biosynthesis transport protein
MNTQPIHSADLAIEHTIEPEPDDYGEVRAFLEALWHNKLIILGIFILFGAISGTVAWMIPGRYKSEAIVMVQPVANLADQNTMNPGVPPEVVRSQLEVARSQNVIGPVVDHLGLMKDPEFAAKGGKSSDTQRATVIANVADRLDIDNDGRSATIHVAFVANSAQKAARVADAIADQYIMTQGEIKSRASQTTEGRLDARLAELRQQAFAAEQEAEEYRRSVGLVTLAPAPDGSDGSTAMSYSARYLDEFSRQAASMTAAATQANAKANGAAADMSSNGGASTPEVLSSTVISSLLQQDAELAKSEASLASKYTAEHPQLIQVRAERAQLHRALAAARGNIEGSLKLEANSAAAAERAASAKAHALQGRVNEEIAEGVRYRQLSREARIKRQTYEDFAHQSGTIAERSLLQLPDVVLVSPASLPIKESWPNRWVIFALGCIAGLVAGCVAAILRALVTERAGLA